MSCTHDHKCEDHECSSDWSLYKHIDLPKVSALNESVSGSAKSVFKAWEQRLHSSEEHLESNEGDCNTRVSGSRTSARAEVRSSVLDPMSTQTPRVYTGAGCKNRIKAM